MRRWSLSVWFVTGALLVACSQVDQAADQAKSVAATGVAVATAAAPAAATARALAQDAGPALATAGAASKAGLATAQALATEVAPLLPTVATAAAQALATGQAAAGGVAGMGTPVVLNELGGLGPVRLARLSLGGGGLALTLRNDTPVAADLSGWGLRVGSALTRLPSGTRLAAGGALTLRVGGRPAGGPEVDLSAAAGVLLPALRPGARVELVNADGQVVAGYSLP